MFLGVMSHILLVDDNDTLREELTREFRVDGHTVTPVSNLGSALTEAKHLSEDSVVVTDKNLGGHRGITPFLDYLQNEKPDVRVIIFSGEISTYAQKELYCHYTLTKGSSDLDRLYELVKR